MGNYNKWNRGEAVTDPSTPVYVVLFVSRNKDNQHLENIHGWTFQIYHLEPVLDYDIV